ncbi:F-box domain-containing protein [Favolaschia claudopus]|uniref:F-box domain-containing protein n=1 Tax=Favolaschia claudopus TaxID=2862362 RepID=A0AAV9ZCZ6_9AGAR
MLSDMEFDRALVAKKSRELLDLEAQMAELATRISMLRGEQLSIQSRLDSYRYPVLTLPNEIVAEVFVHFLPPYPDPPPLSGRLSPLRLTHICHQWRKIALATPKLWRAMDLTELTWFYEDRAEAASSSVSSWLERSGSCPLSIRVPSDKVWSSFSTALVPHSTRCEHLSFRLSGAGQLSAMDIQIPMLRSLSLQFDDRARCPFRFQNLPLLRSVNLDDVGSTSVVLPWAQLTCLTLKNLYPDICMSVLQQTSQLVDCALDLWDWDAPQIRPQNLPTVTLSRLERLEFLPESDIDADFFNSLVTPALRSLRLDEGFLYSLELNPPDRKPIDTLRTFIAKSGCPLRQLKILDATVSDNVYRDAFPSICFD